MKKTTVLLAGLMSISILSSNIISAYAAEKEVQPSENVAVNDNPENQSESEKIPCLVSVRFGEDFNAGFLKDYKKSLIDEGKSADDVKSIVGALNLQINETGKIDDPDIEAKRLEYCAKKTDEELDRIVSEIGIKRSEAEILPSGDRYNYNIKASLTSEQRNAAEKLTGCHKIVFTEEEAVKYNGKIKNQEMIDLIREGKERFKVNITVIPSDSEMTETEYNAYVAEMLSPFDITSFELNVVSFGYIGDIKTALKVSATISEEQLVKLCELESVKGVDSTEFHAPTAVPTSEPTAAPSAVPTNTPEDKGVTYQTGDISGDGIIDLSDLTTLSLALVGDSELTSDQLSAADIDGNGKADLSDLARLKQYLSKVITSL